MMSRGKLAVQGDELVAGQDAGPVGRRPGGHRDHSGEGHGLTRIDGARPWRGAVGRRAQPVAGVDVDKVLLASPRGFCAGVEMAIKALAWMVRVFEPPVYCYHEIVHNQVVVDRFRQLGVIFVDDVSEVPPGRPLMLSAHGSAPEVVEAARASGGAVVNAVCPLVTKVHHEVKLRASKGYSIVYVGHEGHEEAMATMAVAPGGHAPGRKRGRGEALPEPGQPGGLPGPDDAGGRRVAQHPRSGAAALARPVGPRSQRPVLRHHQPAGRPAGHRRPLRRHGRHR